MKEYHKINSIFKRSIDGKKMLFGEYSVPEFDYLKNNQWLFTEKVDGTNIRVIWDGVKVLIKGKTDNAQIHWQLIEKIQALLPVYKFTDIFKDIPLCLYGEGYGAGIQKGGGLYKLEKDFVLFDVMINETWLERSNCEDVAEKLGIEIVPIIGRGTLLDAQVKVETGFVSTWGNFIAEGLVIKPIIELCDRRGGRIITKIKHRDFK